MRRFCSLVAVLAALSPASVSAARETVDRVVAVIEDEIITLRELEAKAQPFLAQQGETQDPNVREARYHQVLKQVLDIEIGEKIVGREIEHNKDKLGVAEKDVDRAVEEVLKMNHLTRDQLQTALYGQGMTWSEYREKLRQQIERARLIQFRVQGKVQIKDADARRRCLERQRSGAQAIEVCASHVLIGIPPEATDAEIDDLHARASKLQAELQAGADFAAYALKYSADKAAPDGKLGCFHHGEMVDAFDQMAFSMKIGDISPVVRTEFGFHIIKVTDRRQSSTQGCDDPSLMEPFRNELYQEEMQRQMNTWVEELRKKAFVEVRL